MSRRRQSVPTALFHRAALFVALLLGLLPLCLKTFFTRQAVQAHVSCSDRVPPLLEEAHLYTIRPSADEIEHRQLSSDTLQRLHGVLEHLGFVVLVGALSEITARTLREDIHWKHRRGRKQAYVHQSDQREHWLLHPFEGEEVSQALVELGVQYRHDGTHEIDGLLQGIYKSNSTLVELAAIRVSKGANSQSPHPDSKPRGDDVRLISAFVALQETTVDMGPLHVLPLSHRCELERPSVLDSCGGRPWLLNSDDVCEHHHLPLPLPSGSAVLMDSRLSHYGGRHDADVARTMFYFTWAEPPSTVHGTQHLPIGSTYALLPTLWGRMTMPLRAGNGIGNDICRAETSAKGLKSETHSRPENDYVWGISELLHIRVVECTEEHGYFESSLQWVSCIGEQALEPMLDYTAARLVEMLGVRWFLCQLR